MYGYLMNNGRDIALSITVVLVIIFSSIQLFQLQEISKDWLAAGETSRRFIISLDQIYTESLSKEPTELYFVNVPIRHGNAWVFPVGLADAAWFVFRNPHMVVNQIPTVEEALKFVEPGFPNYNKRIFVISSSGVLQEVIKTKEGNAFYVK